MSHSLMKSCVNRASDSNAKTSAHLALVMNGCRSVRNEARRVASFLRPFSASEIHADRFLFTLATIAKCVTAIAVAVLASDPNVVIAIGVSV